jgi:protein ImuB
LYVIFEPAPLANVRVLFYISTMLPLRRILAVWLPRLPTDRLARTDRAPAPCERLPRLTAGAERGRQLVRAVDAAAEAAGLHPGMGLADARAIVPALDVRPEDPAADAATLARVAGWCGRFTPWVAVDGADGLWLDVTGCAHLFGGEAPMLADLVGGLARHGFTARAAVADTAGAAWATARFATASPLVVPPNRHGPLLAGLPVEGLRLPSDTVATLRRLGVRRIGELARLPRAGLADRFGESVALRLDQALGRVEEPISPRPPGPVRFVRLAFAEAIATAEALAAATRHLLDRLAAVLDAAGEGARRLRLALFRVDGHVRALEVGTSRPNRDAAHLARLFAEPLGTVEPGLGIDAMTLAAAETAPLAPRQTGLGFAAGRGGLAAPADPPLLDAVEIADLVDRLAVRLGPDRVLRLVPRESHWPERAARAVRADDPRPAAGARWPDPERPRPLRLFDPPEPVEAVAPVPDDPPLLFRWRGAVHRIGRAEGPERLLPEWWRLAPDPGTAGEPRDYYRVEDLDGHRFWLYRRGLWHPEVPPAWFLHGRFG